MERCILYHQVCRLFCYLDYLSQQSRRSKRIVLTRKKAVSKHVKTALAHYFRLWNDLNEFSFYCSLDFAEGKQVPTKNRFSQLYSSLPDSISLLCKFLSIFFRPLMQCTY